MLKFFGETNSSVGEARSKPCASPTRYRPLVKKLPCGSRAWMERHASGVPTDATRFGGIGMTEIKTVMPQLHVPTIACYSGKAHRGYSPAQRGPRRAARPAGHSDAVS